MYFLVEFQGTARKLCFSHVYTSGYVIKAFNFNGLFSKDENFFVRAISNPLKLLNITLFTESCVELFAKEGDNNDSHSSFLSIAVLV